MPEQPERPERRAATVSAVVLTRNEAECIADCLSRLRWADEILVVDSFSTDNTRELAAAAGAKVLTHAFTDFSSQYNWALAQAAGDWVYTVDADEMTSPELAESIVRTVRANPRYRIYTVRRDSYVFGRLMRSTAWSGERLPRLFRRGEITYTGEVHQDPRIGGRPTGRLDGILHHRTYRSMAQYFDKFQLYSTLWAEKAYARGRRTGIAKAVAGTVWHLFHNYFIRGEILDGVTGVACCLLGGAYVFIRHMKLWGLQNAEKFAEKNHGADGKG